MTMDSKETMTEMEFKLLKGAFERQAEENARLEPIYAAMSKTPFIYVQDVYTIGDEYQFARVTDRRRGAEPETFWVPFVRYGIVNYWAKSLEEAMLIALAVKTEGIHTRAHEYMAKMLGLPRGE